MHFSTATHWESSSMVFHMIWGYHLDLVEYNVPNI